MACYDLVANAIFENSVKMYMIALFFWSGVFDAFAGGADLVD